MPVREPVRRMFGRKRRWLPAAILALCAAAALAVTAAVQLRPILTTLAASRVTNAVNGIVSRAVNETVYQDGVDYDRFVTLEKDNDGRVCAVKSNMAEFNRLQSAIIANVLEKMSEVTTRELSIPLGSLTGSPLLAGRGPALRVRMQSVGSPGAHFENAFTAAGINQTKHQIRLVVDVSVSILLPGFTTGTRVSNSFTVAETVIVGAVPESYTYFQSNDIKDTAEEYVLNG